MKINRRRNRAIEQAERVIERYESWKEEVLSLGGTLRKDSTGKYSGALRCD